MALNEGDVILQFPQPVWATVTNLLEYVIGTNWSGQMIRFHIKPLGFKAIRLSESER